MVLLLLLLLLSLSSTNRSCLGLSIFISSVFSPRSHLVFFFLSSPSPRVFLSGFPSVPRFFFLIFFHSLFDVNYWSEQKGGDCLYSCKPGLLDWMQLSSSWFWLVQTRRAFARSKGKETQTHVREFSGLYILGWLKQLLCSLNPCTSTNSIHSKGPFKCLSSYSSFPQVSLELIRSLMLHEAVEYVHK